MNIAVDELAISVFNKPLNECSIAELKLMAHQYPWFGPAQLLYAKKLQAGNATFYEDQVQKTSLYFQNRLWLQHLLNGNGSHEIITHAQPSREEKILSEKAEEVKPVTLTEPVIYEHETTAEPTEESPVAIGTIIEEPVPGEPVNASVEMFSNDQPGNEEKVLTENAGEEESLPAEEEPGVQAEKEPALEMPRLKFETIKIMNAPLTFEPYHTIDYFASQGIKFKEEEKPKDQFSQQLKSFTEWLKTLKRVPASEIAAVAASDTVSEKKVEQMAEHSLAERHVITEAMAEVWIKQGNSAKAEEIYRKLSLLDPQKTAYFAAKIEEIKKTS